MPYKGMTRLNKPLKAEPPPAFRAQPYEINYMTDEMRRRAKAELFEDEDTRINSMRLFRSMLREEKDLDWQDSDEWLLAYLRVRKFDVKRAFNVMRNFYHAIGKHHEVYANFNYERVRKSLEENLVGFLPYRDEEGCVILMINTVAWNPAENNLGDVMRELTCGLIHAIKSPPTQVAGFKVIVDFKNFTFYKLTHISPSYLWLFAEALQNCFPGRFRAVHIVNEGYLFSYIWKVLKQLLSQKLRDRFHFHGKNVMKLHRHFHPSILPAEYNGDLPAFDNKEWAKKLELIQNDLTEVFSHGYAKYRKTKK